MDVEALRTVLNADPGSAGIFCDFDGTLSPIVADPDEARPVEGAREALAALTERFAVVAVVSGRPLVQLAAWIDVPGVRLAGLYGVEQRIGTETRVDPVASEARETVARAVKRLRSEVSPEQGVWVENKGLAVAVHFRRAQDPARTQDRVAPAVLAIARAEGLLGIRVGKMVMEAGPLVAASDKGSAVKAISEERKLTAGVFVGDDLGDIDAFDAIHGLPNGIAVAVADREAPPALVEAADLTVADPAAVVELLRALAA